ncbi:MAG TPA: argininosuccinate lyase [Gemmatimonadales bacterium]|nr:argininosuccinate lyase [Gemmatimonadales bacterium]
MTGHQMWGGRFGSAPHPAFAALNRSLPVDHRLWRWDIQGSVAWARALRRAGILSGDEEHRMLAGLDRVAARLAAGDPSAEPDEDVHTLVERLLYDEVGDLAGKLHTGRSRNDQVSTDLRLWCQDAVRRVDQEVAALGAALVRQAAGGLDLILPGYTHGQRAQPVRWGYVLAAHAWPLIRDRERLAQAAHRASELPLGSGALAGSGISVDRGFLREALGFRALAPNALDVTGDRDFVADLLYALAALMTHASRLAGELMTYASSEYGFVRLDDAYCTGSSLMPQKRNPDVLELARGRTGSVVANLSGLLGILKGLPAGYSKDLQEDKRLVFDATDTVLTVLPALAGAVETLRPNPERMTAALDPGMLATDLADALVRHGVAFREAHGLVGRLVREAEEAGVDLPHVALDRALALHPDLPGLLQRLGSFADSVERRATEGGSSRASVEAQLKELAGRFAVSAGENSPS